MRGDCFINRGIKYSESRQRGQDKTGRGSGIDSATLSRTLYVRPEPAGRGRGVEARKRDRVVAARSDRYCDGEVSRAERLFRTRFGLGRRALDDSGGHRRRDTCAGADGGVVRKIYFARRGRFRE